MTTVLGMGQRLAVGVLCAVVSTQPAGADAFYKLTIVAETPATAAVGQWLVDSSDLGFNDQGMAVWQQRRAVQGGATEFGIFMGDGRSSPLLLSTGSNVNSEAALTNAGQVAFLRPVGGVFERQLWDGGAISTLYQCSVAPNPIRCSGDGVSDGLRFGVLATTQLQIVGPTGAIEQFASIQGFSGGSFGGSTVISRNGRYAGAVLSAGNNLFAGMIDDEEAFPTLSTMSLGSRSTYAVEGQSINNFGNLAFITFKGQAGTLRPAVTVAVRRGPNTGLAQVVDFGSGVLTDTTSLTGPSINNVNEVAFVGVRGQEQGVYVGDVSGNPLRTVVVQGQQIFQDGTVFGQVRPNGLVAQSLNDKGSLVFHATVQRNGQNYNAVLRADPLPGVSPANPLLPEAGDISPGAGWVIRGFGGFAAGQIVYGDPEAAVGYDYHVVDGPSFESVLVPAPLRNGDEEFTLEFLGRSETLYANRVYRFTDIVPEGVYSFRISGIDTAELLDPADPAAFVTGFGFTAAPTDLTAVRMAPLVAQVPETPAAGMLSAGLVVLGWCWFRRRRSWAIVRFGESGATWRTAPRYFGRIGHLWPGDPAFG